MSSAKIVKSRFQAAPWLLNRHAQTLWPQFFHPACNLNLRNERVELDDGDFIDLSWTENSSGPLVLVFHGLEGSVDSPYAQGILAAIHAQGWRGVLMHFRGCSQELNRLDRNYHSGETGDIAFIIDTLHRRSPDTPITAIAYSLGRNALLKYLGETPDNPLNAATAISVPFLLNIGADQLNKGFSRIYQHHLITRLHKKMKKKYHGRQSPVNPESVSELNTFWLFDNDITAPLHGFTDAEDYYSKSSCRQYLKHIQTPTLILHALDDPFLNPQAIPEIDELSDLNFQTKVDMWVSLVVKIH